ncbi:MAG: HGGxSTG domain-containing protein [Pseudomonadota bacterium]
MYCGAKLPDGSRCMSEPVKGKRRCRLHGGLSTGAKSPEGQRRQSEAAKARWAEIHEALTLARNIRQTNEARA